MRISDWSSDVCSSDLVGDRGDTVGLADADDLADHEPPHQEYQCRTEVDRQKVDAAGGGAAHRSVESPGGAVDGDGEGIDPRAADDAAPAVGPLVGKVGDGEEQAEIGEGEGHEAPGCENGSRPLRPQRSASPGGGSCDAHRAPCASIRGHYDATHA